MSDYMVVVRWNSAGQAWEARPSAEPWGVTFISTNDPAATPPNDANLKVGDIWHAHPDTVVD
jgi:hypothetical protein